MTNKTGQIVRIVIASLAAAAFTVLLVLGINGGLSFPSFFRKGEEHMITSVSRDASGIRDVQIDWRAGRVEVTRSADGSFHATETSRYDADPMLCTTDGGVLRIKQQTGIGFFFFGFGSRSSTLTLQLPEKEYEAFQLKMSSGEGSVTGINAASQRFELTSGDLRVDALQADSLTAKLTSGQLTGTGVAARALDAGTTSGRLSLSGAFSGITAKCTSGKITLDSSLVPDTLDVNVTSGDVGVTIPDNDGFVLESSKTSGDIRSSFDLLSPINDKSGRYVYKSDETGRSYRVKLTSGNFTFDRAE